MLWRHLSRTDRWPLDPSAKRTPLVMQPSLESRWWSRTSEPTGPPRTSACSDMFARPTMSAIATSEAPASSVSWERNKLYPCQFYNVIFHYLYYFQICHQLRARTYNRITVRRSLRGWATWAIGRELPTDLPGMQRSLSLKKAHFSITIF